MKPRHLVIGALVAAVALSLLAAALPRAQARVLGEPRGPARPAVALAAALPAIGEFEREYHRDPWNPFVPWQSPENGGRKPDAPEPLPAGDGKARPEPDESGTQGGGGAGGGVRSAPRLPRGGSYSRQPPDCRGLIRHIDSGRTVLVVSDAAGGDRPVLPGEEVDGWTLLGLAGGDARWRGPGGGVIILAIPAVVRLAEEPTP